MARSEKQKEKLFRILEMLMEESDETHGLSVNEIIDRLSDDEIVEAVEFSNGYGNKYIKVLRERGMLNKKVIKAMREAMKYVGAFSSPLVIKQVQNK